ncbi:MAG: phenylalanine--tRNA ligase subunit beta, partial [Leuconostoc sp.]|nr:phenylalanine--tRNA ligase subunit beta [Leuconostoc sp.]
EQYVGFVGQIHPKITKKQKLAPVFGFELNLFTVFNHVTDSIQFNPISRFPQISRDAALLVDQATTNSEISATIVETAGEHLVDVTLFDVYTGNNLPESKKSLAYTLTYQDSDGTLLETDVNSDFEHIMSELQSKFNVEIR